MSKGEGTTPQTRKANAMREVTVNEVLNQYVPIRVAERIKEEKTPYIDFILSHRNCDRISVRELGEELIGVEKYHEKRRYYDGVESDYRSFEALTVTSTLTQALRKLCKMGVMTRHEEKDMSRLVEYECEDYVYFDKEGHQLPDKIDVIAIDGTILQISTQFLPGVQRRLGMCKKKAHPKIVYYTFNE